MSGLSDYLNSLNRDGWSTRRISEEAEKHGHKLSNATASRYLSAKHPKRPAHETLQAFADVFGTNVERLREAAGLPGGGAPFELGPEFSRLNGPQREAVRTVARLFLEQNDELAGHAVDDGPSPLRERVLAYLERNLVTDEKWPDFELLPVDARDDFLDRYVDLGVELIEGEVGPEEVVLPMVVENAAGMLRAVMLRLQDEAGGHRSTPDPEASARAKAARRRWTDARDAAHGIDSVTPIVVEGLDDRPTDATDDQSAVVAEDLESRPWEKDEYRLAAKRGRNRGREARDQQDREAEDGGA